MTLPRVLEGAEFLRPVFLFFTRTVESLALTMSHRPCANSEDAMRDALIIGALAAGLSSQASGQPAVEGFAFVRASGGIWEYRLKSNDLQVLLLEDRSAPVVCFMITYRVGSRNEAPGYTGATHLLEHLMFKGTPTFNKQRGTAIPAVLQNAGAIMNATTWNDRTNYFAVLPSDRLELAVHLEADRMRNALLLEEDLRSEMTVVRNEFERGENSPFQALSKAVWATAYWAHPYHHPTIGWRSDIENVPIERLRWFYETYYWPNNATVTVIGDFRAEEALALIRRYFEPIPKAPHPFPDVYTAEPPQQGPRRVTVKRAGQLGAVLIGHKSPAGLERDTDALEVLATILSEGKSSRLYKALVDQNLASSVSCNVSRFRDPGLFTTFVSLAPGADHGKVEAVVLAEYARLAQEGVSAEELERAKNQLRTQYLFSRDGPLAIASQLNEAIAMGDWTFYTAYLERIQAVTADDVRRVAARYLVEDQMTVGYYVPTPARMARAGATSDGTAPPRYGPWYLQEDASRIRSASRGAPQHWASRVRIQQLGPIRLITVRTNVEGVITLRGSFEGGGTAYAGYPLLASITAQMLDKGTRRRDKFQIAQELERRGAQLSFSAGTFRLGFSARFLKQDQEAVLELLAEQLREPAFDAGEFEKVKLQALAGLRRALESTAAVARNVLLRQLYDPQHPNYEPDLEEQLRSLEALTLEDVRRFYETHYGPQRMILVAVGDVDEASLARSVRRLFGGWASKTLKATFVGRVRSQTPSGVLTRYMPDKANVDVYLAHPLALTRTDPDYMPVFLANFILGGNFSARLMQTVRDSLGLTYGIGSSLSGITPWTQGHWQITVTLAPENTRRGIEATQEQLRKFVQGGVSSEEVEAKKSTLIGNFKVGLATSSGLASTILNYEELGLGVTYLDRYPLEIQRLTVDQINQVIRKYFHPDRLLIVAAGTVEDWKTELAPVRPK